MVGARGCTLTSAEAKAGAATAAGARAATLARSIFMLRAEAFIIERAAPARLRNAPRACELTIVDESGDGGEDGGEDGDEEGASHDLKLCRRGKSVAQRFHLKLWQRHSRRQ